MMRLRSQVPKSSPGRRGPASFDEECSSTTDGATTSVAGCQSVRTQQDAWCEVDYLGAADGARNSCARPAATGKALVFPLRNPYCQCR